MFRKILFALIIAAAVFTAVISANERPAQTEVKLYMADAEILRLIPVQTYINDADPQTQAKTVIRELIRGRDSNPKIRRLIPNEPRCVSVSVSGGTAVVNLRPKYFKDIIMNRDLEYLCVYQIVNSLVSIDEIDTVRFTIDGKTQKKFKGFVDMREIFVPDYFM